ncbi:type VI secretion system lipoprotein TssJ [Noviherbaspirillum sp.]|uniref:type VI secretion system lipoprotein TssJ n=1 Tax=Noviherbaspirillum sp. TaxID=1926288 RepID=UPI002FE054B4
MRQLMQAMLVLALCSGCAIGPKTFAIKGEADTLINRDASGRPLSVVVRIYQLKNAGEFSKLTFDTLASGRPESEFLGADMLERNEIVLVPGAKYTNSDKIRPDARYVGVVAFFRQPDPHFWRFLVDTEQVRSKGLNFRVQDCYLILESPKPIPIPGQVLDARFQCGAQDIRNNIIPRAGNPASSNPPQQSVWKDLPTRTGPIEQILVNKP